MPEPVPEPVHEARVVRTGSRTGSRSTPGAFLMPETVPEPVHEARVVPTCFRRAAARVDRRGCVLREDMIMFNVLNMHFKINILKIYMNFNCKCSKHFQKKIILQIPPPTCRAQASNH